MSSFFVEETLAVVRGQKRLADKALVQLDDGQFHQALGPETNCIAVIIKHMAGNMASRWTDFLTADGEKPGRERDGEFIDTFTSRAEILACWEAGWAHVFGTLERLTDDDLRKPVTIRGQPHTAAGAVLRQVDHYGYHVGRIVQIARMLVGERSHVLTIAKGGSKAFNERVAAKPAP